MELVNIAILMSILFVGKSYGFSDGAPAVACPAMFPEGHVPYNSQTTNITDYIEIRNDGDDTYRSGTKIRVDIVGYFMGFLLQARRVDDWGHGPVGTFTDLIGDAKYLSCVSDKDSVTHTFSFNKPKVTVYWEPPNTDQGEIHFVATIVEQFSIFWVNVTSRSLHSAANYSTDARCNYNGKMYSLGNIFMDKEDCGSCVCGFNGITTCSGMICNATTTATCPVIKCPVIDTCPSPRDNYKWINGIRCRFCPVCFASNASKGSIDALLLFMVAALMAILK